jgi:hypothetical protein
MTSEQPPVKETRPEGVPDLDELQRGQEQPVTLEEVERLTPPSGEHREIPIPDPGERPGAIHPEDAPLEKA